MSGYRYIVAKVGEQDLRTLLYETNPTRRQITVTDEQNVADLTVSDLQALGLWQEANDLAGDLAAGRPPMCEAVIPRQAPTCRRAQGHPSLDQDGIGHSASARYQYL